VKRAELEPSQKRKDPGKNLVGCVVGDVNYALPIASVREIVNPLSIVELPGAPAAVIGVADYRDEVVPVVDLRTRFGLGPCPATRRTKWIILHREEGALALVVDVVTGVFRSGELKPPPALGSGDDTRGLEGVTTYLGSLVFVLDASRFDELVAPVVRAIGGAP
jgi:purine-binding chemotaxis protein CheW